MLGHPSRRRLLTAIAGAGIACQGLALAQTPEPPRPTEDTSLTLSAWVGRWGRPSASVMINGAGPFRFLVDTGANTSVVSRRIVEQLALPVGDSVLVNGITGSANFPMAVIDDLVCGTVSRRAMRVAVIPETNLFRFEGVLGGDVFAGRKLSFDIPASRVTLSRGAVGPRDRERANIRLRNETLVELSGRIGKVAAVLMLDTGADECVVNGPLARELVSAHPTMLRVDRATVLGVTGQSIAGEYLALPRVSLGEVNVDRIGAIAVDAPIFAVWGLEHEKAMIVGMNVLSRAERFSIDYSARRFDLIPLAGLAEGRLRQMA
jgi:predicted aspartyl protease